MRCFILTALACLTFCTAAHADEALPADVVAAVDAMPMRALRARLQANAQSARADQAPQQAPAPTHTLQTQAQQALASITR